MEIWDDCVCLWVLFCIVLFFLCVYTNMQKSLYFSAWQSRPLNLQFDISKRQVREHLQ